MKKTLLTLLITLCGAMNTLAQELEGLSINISLFERKTNLLYGDNNRIDPSMGYQGEGLHTGSISNLIKLGFTKTGGQVKESANTLFEVSFTDPYGRVPSYFVDYDKISAFTKRMKVVNKYEETINAILFLNRGGQYTYRNYIPGLNYLYEETVEVIDEPSARVEYADGKVGKDIHVTAFYNTGYPYDVNKFNGSEKATLRLYALRNDDKGSLKETEILMTEKTLRLYRPDQPLVAALDSIKLYYCDPEPGEYLLKMSSDWTQTGANRDNIHITVCDTLRAYAKLLTPIYVAGTDKELKLHLKMNYGYPYIMATEVDKTPTVRIITSVTESHDNEGLIETETLLSTTKTIQEASFEEKPLDWEGDIVVSAIEEQEKAPLTKSILHAQVVVEFNGAKQFTASIPFYYVPASSSAAVRSIPNEKQLNSGWYNLNGHEIPNTPTAKGIYIAKGKKVVIK